MKLSRKITLTLAVVISMFFAFSAASGETIKARAVFIGDIMVHAEQIEAAKYGESWDFKPQFRRVKPLFWKALASGNLETVFAGGNEKYAGYPVFNTPDELASALSDLEINIITLANNHILDRGYSAARRTTEVLDNAGIFWTGLVTGEDPDEPLVVEYAGLRWAFVNFSYGTNNSVSPGPEDLRLNIISEESIASALERAASYDPDVTIAVMHWGMEYQHVPSRGQRDMASICVQRGADIVIGSHPHVLQPVEVMNGEKGYSVIAYSMGNFISYQRSALCDRSAVLAVEVEKEDGGRARLVRVSAAPVWVSVREENGSNKIEVMYAGTGGPFNHSSLPETELVRAREAGQHVLEFLGAKGQADANGFYTIWDAAAPYETPHPTRETPE